MLGNVGNFGLDLLVRNHAATFAYQIAQVYALGGNRDKAFEWLDRALRQHDGGLLYLKRDRLLVPLRGDSRFADLLRRLNLPA
jgi:hypothetical protein